MNTLASLNEQRRHSLACIHEVGHAIVAEHLGHVVTLVANNRGDGDCTIADLAKRHWSQVGIAGKVAEALFLGRPVERHVAAAFYGQPAAFDADGQPLNDAAFAGRYWRRHLATVTDILKERREALEARARALMGAAL